MKAPTPAPGRRAMSSTVTATNGAEQPLLVADGVTKYYCERLGCRGSPSRFIRARSSRSSANGFRQIDAAGLLCNAGAQRGRVSYRQNGHLRDLAQLSEAERRAALQRTDLGLRAQDPREGTAHERLAWRQCRGAPHGDRLAPLRAHPADRERHGWRASRSTRRDRRAPRSFSAQMRQRLQIAKTLFTHPRLVFRTNRQGPRRLGAGALLDLIRELVAQSRPSPRSS